MIDVVYLLCALTSLACVVLLWRGWKRSGARLLFWSALCFVGLFLNNVLLIIDTHVLPQMDLALARMIPALLGALALVYGLVWDTQ
jgi:hydrogenase/urease accessory protein HupE